MYYIDLHNTCCVVWVVSKGCLHTGEVESPVLAVPEAGSLSNPNLSLDFLVHSGKVKGLSSDVSREW